MKKLFFLAALLSVESFLFAQNYQEILPAEHIKTVQLFNPRTNDQTPVIRMGDYFILSFDDLNGGRETYNYTIEHRNADWSESGAFQSEYIDGYTNSYIQAHRNSFNTYQNYTHYSIQIPNKDVNVKLSGNYVLKVYTKDKNKPLFTKRFAIYEDGAAVGIYTERALGKQNLNQRVEVTVSSRHDLTQTPDGAKLFIMKNGNWKDYLSDLYPQFTQTNQLIYNKQDNLFEGGSEYLWFDTKYRDRPGMSTERIFKSDEDSIYHAVIRANIPQNGLPYYDEGDVNGSFYVRNAYLNNETRSGYEADYVWVHLALADFDDENEAKELYVVGAFNDWNISPEYQLHFSESSNMHEVSLFLKQGFYNYQYAVKDKNTNQVSLSEVNGSFWQTENIYQALFYLRPWGGRYDLLIGYGEVSTRK